MRNISVVQVSDVHLKQGEPGSESWCALAVSLREELRAHDALRDEIEVTSKWVRVQLRHGTWWAETTLELREFIGQFDSTADDDGNQDPEKLKALQAKASAGLLAFPLTWHEGNPPDYNEDSGD